MVTSLGLECGTESNRPFALAVVGDLTSSTVLSLFLAPTIVSPDRERGSRNQALPVPTGLVEVHS
jgi:Cu/Ag efflux pump CusA